MSLKSGNQSREIIYIYDLPYTERKCLCNILDINDQWERLGGEKFGFSVIELSEIKRVEKCGESPTDRLLQLWGRKNNTILNLYLLLYEIEHYQAMSVLQPFIPKEYHLDKIRESLNLYKNEEKPIEYRKPPKNMLVQLTENSQSYERIGNSPSDNNINNEETQQTKNINKNVTAVITTDGAISNLPQKNNHMKIGFRSEGNFVSIVKGKDFKKETNSNYEKINNVGSAHSLQNNNKNQQNANNSLSKTQNKSTFNPKLISPLHSIAKITDLSQKRHTSMSSNLSTLSECGVPMIPYQELEDATQNWNKQHLLGSGGFGSVYKGTWINVHVAIKRINFSTENESIQAKSHNVQQTLDELKYLLKFRHDNILQIYGFSAEDDKPLCLVYQFMPNGSLEYRLQCKKIEGFGDKDPKPLTWYERFYVAKGTAAALEYLHTVQDKPLIHGDVKSANILLDKNLEPKLGDFGLAREGPQSQYTSMQVSHVHGTRPYIPEEYLRSKTLSTKVDIYSYGIVLFEICTGCRAYNDKSRKYLKDEVLFAKDHNSLKDSKGGADSVNVFKILLNIGLECVNKNKKQRPDMKITFQKLELFSKALTGDDHFIDGSAISPSVSPLPFHGFQDTMASHSTSPSTFQSATPFLHPSHIHQLAHIPSPSLHPFSPLSNPPRSPVPHMISGIPLTLAHGWMKGLNVNTQNTAGGNIYQYSPNLLIPAAARADISGNNNIVNEAQPNLLPQNELMNSECQMPIPDLSRLMVGGSSIHQTNITDNSCTDISDTDIEESSTNFSMTIYENIKDTETSDNLLKLYTSEEEKISERKNTIVSEQPSSIGKKSLLD